MAKGGCFLMYFGLDDYMTGIDGDENKNALIYYLTN